MSQKKFLKFIAYLQIIGIILVVFGHSFHEYPDGLQGKTLLCYRMPFSFRMPLFLFVSGFLLYFTTFKSGKSVHPTHFIFMKFKRLIIPYLVLGAVTFIPRANLSAMADDPVSLDMKSFAESFFYSDKLVIPFFWFIQVSFILLTVCYTILYMSRKNARRHEFTIFVLILISLLLYFLPFPTSTFLSTDYICVMAVYFVSGIAYARHKEKIDLFLPWTDLRFTILLALIWAVLFFLTENTTLIIFCSVAGIMMCISIAKIMERHNLTFLDHLTGANYIIFLLSWYFNVLSQQVLHHYVELPWWVFTLLSLTCGIYIPFLFYRIMQNHPTHPISRIFAFLLGQSFRDTNTRHTFAGKRNQR
ncbi:MAG: acyltransferase [Muribaculaceae bacterium]|nr:acyltransferase [Muribaculaceae bacterium]